MPYDPVTGGTGVSGLLGGAFSNPLFNFGLGLLSQGGGTTPTSSLQKLAGGLGYASKAQQQALENQYYRDKLGENARELAGQQAFADAVAKGGLPLPAGMTPDTASALFKANPDAASKAYMNYAFPAPAAALTPADVLAMESQRLSNEAKQAEAAGGAGDNALIYRNSVMAKDAVDYLTSIPGGGSLLVNPSFIPYLRKAKEAGFLDPESASAAGATALLQIPRDQWGRALDAAESIQKARANVSNMQQSSNRSVLGLQTRMTGFGEGAGPDVQQTQFGWAVDTSKAMARAANWDLPDVDSSEFAWRRGEKAPSPRAVPAAAPDLGAGPGVAPPQGPAAAALPPVGSGVFGSSPAGAGVSVLAPPPPAPQPTPPIPIKGVRTSEFSMINGVPVPKYRDPAMVEKIMPELKRKGIKSVIVVDPNTGIPYTYSEQ